MLTLSLSERVQKFKTSSAFTSGDPFSFGVVLDKNLSLPGKFDPEIYIQNLGQSVKGKTVCVVCPGNGGLCVEALRMGAETVVAYELRTVYQRSLRSISEFAAETLGSTFELPATATKPDSYDIIIWSEGLDEIRDPKSIIAEVISSLAPGGVLYFELSHGTAGPVPAQTNSWKPTKDGFLATISEFKDVEVSGELPGRNQTRTIYKIQSLKASSKPGAPKLPNPQADSMEKEDVEYFRRLLLEAMNSMKADAAGTPKTADAMADATGLDRSDTIGDDKVGNRPELSEVYEREAEATSRRASTPKSRRKGAKDSKS